MLESLAHTGLLLYTVASSTGTWISFRHSIYRPAHHRWKAFIWDILKFEKLTFLADLEHKEFEHDLRRLMLFGALGDNGSAASCWPLLMESAWENGPFAATPSSVTRTLGVRLLRGLKIVGMSPSFVIAPTYTSRTLWSVCSVLWGKSRWSLWNKKNFWPRKDHTFRWTLKTWKCVKVNKFNTIHCPLLPIYCPLILRYILVPSLNCTVAFRKFLGRLFSCYFTATIFYFVFSPICFIIPNIIQYHVFVLHFFICKIILNKLLLLNAPQLHISEFQKIKQLFLSVTCECGSSKRVSR